LSGAPLGLILGGSDKMADFSELAQAIAASPHVRAIALIGQTADRLESDLLAAGYSRSGGGEMEKAPGLEKAVEYLLSKMETGSIALSPACASFGMFENYKERGKAFKRLVAGL
jgi:UDP-N-acetylmuramoylalanine--D-glutamate ligase